jgi:type II secretory pathway pseudopilin PulG
MQVSMRSHAVKHHEAGFSFMETLVGLVILSIVVMVFLTGLMTMTRGAVITDELATAESIARSQAEWAQSASYSFDTTGYATSPLLEGKDYANYSASISAQPLNSPDNGIQKITVTVMHFDKQVFVMETYKTDR